MSTETNQEAFESPWIEKYRPQFLKDIVGNTESVSRLQAIAEVGNLPNIILSGPPGIGKTTSILCLAHQMLGYLNTLSFLVIFKYIINTTDL